MRKLLLAFLLAFTSQSVRAATAYEALRTVGKQRGESTLDKVTELRGEHGAPQPREWKIIARDTASRSGVKEFIVQGTRLAGERAPTSRATGSLLNMGQLNLDSDGAHQIAEREAKKAGFGYDYVDYSLRAGTHGGSPVWELRMVDSQTGDAATMTLAATTGKVLATDGFVNRRRTAPIAQAPSAVTRPGRPDYYEPAPDSRRNLPPQPEAERNPESSAPPLGIRVNRWFGRAGIYIGKRFNQAGEAIGNVFSGNRRHDAGPRDASPGEYSDRPQRGSIDEDYTRPSRVRD
jgi:hypothetical protein